MRHTVTIFNETSYEFLKPWSLIDIAIYKVLKFKFINK